ncbi:MAG: HesA/MoeB/ThiF family protein [Ignavibacteria bacterium]
MNSESSRYSRQIILKEIGAEGQEKLLHSKVLVAGAGGLGCPVLAYLAAAGVGTLGILDYDVVERSNLHRQIFYNESQTGLPKAEAVLENLNELNSEINYNVHNNFLNSKNGFEIIKDYDIVVDATDNFKARYLINDICVILDKPFVSASVNKFEAQIMVLNYKNGPTYRCIFPEIPSSKSLMNCEESGVIGSLCGIAGSIQATEVLKIILEAGNVLSGEMLVINSLNMEFRKLKVSRTITVNI